MKTATKVWLIVGISLAVVGAAVFAGAMAIMHNEPGRLGGKKYETNTYEITEGFEDISIVSGTDDISLVLSDDESCKVVCYEQKGLKHTVRVNDKILEVRANDTREWYEHISFFNFESPKMTVYLPKDSYSELQIDTETGDVDIPGELTFNSIDISGTTGDVSCSASTDSLIRIELSTGNIKLNGASAGKMELKTTTGNIRAEAVSSDGELTVGVSTGDVLLTDVSCKSLSSDGSTGAIDLKNVIASESLDIERSTGDVIFDGCDADEIFIKTSTGDVTGSFLSGKMFTTDTSTGDVRVPESSEGGKCTVKTSTGDINIGVKESK